MVTLLVYKIDSRISFKARPHHLKTGTECCTFVSIMSENDSVIITSGKAFDDTSHSGLNKRKDCRRFRTSKRKNLFSLFHLSESYHNSILTRHLNRISSCFKVYIYGFEHIIRFYLLCIIWLAMVYITVHGISYTRVLTNCISNVVVLQ